MVVHAPETAFQAGDRDNRSAAGDRNAADTCAGISESGDDRTDELWRKTDDFSVPVSDDENRGILYDTAGEYA